MRHAVGPQVGQQFAGIVGADRVDLVGIEHSALEQVDVAVVIADALFVVGNLGHGPELLALEHPLERRVVNADHAVSVLEEGVVGMSGFQQQRQQAGVPVVAVHYLGGKGELLAGVQRGGGQEGETLAVVRIGLVVFGIELGAIEVLRAVEQVDTDPFEIHLIDAIADIRQARVGWQPARDQQFGLIPSLYRLVEREHDPDIMSLLGQVQRQGSGHVRQAPGLHKPLNFRGNEQDFQWVNSQLLLP